MSLIPNDNVGITQALLRLVFQPNPTDYPYDVQHLILSIEPPNGALINTIEYYFMRENSGISPQLRLRGWKWDPTTKGFGNVVQRTYFGDRVVTSLQWGFFIQRTSVLAVQVLLPPVFVLASVLISFILPVTGSITRIGIIGSALISEVSLHVGFKKTNGVTNSLGLIDYFFILIYIIILISLAVNVLVMVILRRSPNSLFVLFVERRTKYFVWFLCPGLYTFIFLRGNQLWVSFICLLGPIIIFTIIDWLIPRIRALKNQLVQKEKAKKNDGEFRLHEEEEAKLQDDELFDHRSLDVKKTVLSNQIIAQGGTKRPNLGADTSSPDLYNTDSEDSESSGRKK